MHWQWILNVTGLAITTIAACLMFFFPPVVTVYTDKGERVISWVGATSDKDRKVAARRRRLSQSAVGLLVLGFLLQFLAALPRDDRGEQASQEEASAMTAPPAECVSAESADECADILAKAGRSPLEAYGVVGRQPAYRRRGSAAPTARTVGPTGAASPLTGDEPVDNAQGEAPAFIGASILPRVALYDAADRPFERFGLDVVYGLVGTLRADTDIAWKLFEYNIGLFDEVVRATYGADAVVRRLDAKDLVRSTDLICRAAAKQSQLPSGPWIVVLRFVRWQDTELLAGPFTIRQADCR